METLKKIASNIVDHKDAIIRRSLIIGGSLAGIALTAGFLTSGKEDDSVEIEDNEDGSFTVKESESTEETED